MHLIYTERLIDFNFSPFQPKTPKTVNFKEYPVDMEGPVVVPEEEVPAKPVKQEKKFFDFFKKKKKVCRNVMFCKIFKLQTAIFIRKILHCVILANKRLEYWVLFHYESAQYQC